MDSVGLNIFKALKINLEGQIPRFFGAIIGREPDIGFCDAGKRLQHPFGVVSNGSAAAIGGPLIMQFYKYGSDNHFGMIALKYERGEKVGGTLRDVAVGVASRV